MERSVKLRRGDGTARVASAGAVGSQSDRVSVQSGWVQSTRHNRGPVNSGEARGGEAKRDSLLPRGACEGAGGWSISRAVLVLFGRRVVNRIRTRNRTERRGEEGVFFEVNARAVKCARVERE